MKTLFFLVNVLVLTLVATPTLLGQATSSRSSNDTVVRDAMLTQEAIKEILQKAGTSFKEGLIAYESRELSTAANRFNKSVEVFLYSALNIQREPRLQNCYNHLVETIYRLEFPLDIHLPQVRGLSGTCGWDIDPTFADKITTIVRNLLTKSVAPGAVNIASSSATIGLVVPDQTQVGFNSLEFVPAIGDELAKVQLTDEEEHLDPNANKKFEYVSYFKGGKSRSFSFVISPMVRQYSNYCRFRARATTEVGLYRSGLHSKMARRIFIEEGMPENLIWISQVVSAWNPRDSRGLWNLNPLISSRYGLQTNRLVSEANSLEESTRSAARYLNDLFNFYQSWELTLAAYDSGKATVDAAIKKSKTKEFALLKDSLPKRTQNFVPMVFATILIANSPDDFGLGHIRPAAALAYDRVRVPPSTDIRQIADVTGTTDDYLRYLNPHLLTNITPATPYILNVPVETANLVVESFRKRNTTEIFSSGETWTDISIRTGVSVQRLKEANPGMAVPRGRVTIPEASFQRPTATTETSYSRPSNREIRVVRARAGETVKMIAERHNANPTDVARFNGLLTNSVLGAGREIRLPPK